MIEHKTSYLQPKIIISETHPSLLHYIWRAIKLVGLMLIILLFIGMLYLYTQGKQAISGFDEEFLGVFSQFVEQVLKQDMAHALVIKTPLEKNVSLTQAIDAMKTRAKLLDIKFVTSHVLLTAPAEKTEAKSKNERLVEVLEFSDEKITPQLLSYSPDFAVYLPYRIAIYTDKEGQAWLTTVDLSLLAHGSSRLPSEVKNQTLQLHDDLLRIVSAGASGAKE